MEDFNTQQDLDTNVITKENQYAKSGINALTFIQIFTGTLAAFIIVGIFFSEHDIESRPVTFLVKLLVIVLLVIFTILIEPLKTIVKAAQLYINEHELK